MDDFDPAYLAYIASERWKIKADTYWLRHGKYCHACGSTRGPLMVHHMSYDHLGREPMTDLMGLCGPCHRGVHSAHRKGGRRRDLRTVTLEYIKQQRMSKTNRKR